MKYEASRNNDIIQAALSSHYSRDDGTFGLKVQYSLLETLSRQTSIIVIKCFVRSCFLPRYNFHNCFQSNPTFQIKLFEINYENIEKREKLGFFIFDVFLLHSLECCVRCV